jgi:hypothetical protein
LGLGVLVQMARRNQGTSVLAGVLLLGLWATAAEAIDLNALAPCRPAAARFCDHSEGMTWGNLIRCGATLAANSFRVGDACRDVLKRYGQL